MIEPLASEPQIADLSALVGDVERGSHPIEDISLVPLVQSWVEALDKEAWADLDVAGFFFTLASRLIVLKLRFLLPTIPEEEVEFLLTPHDFTVIDSLSHTLALLEEQQQDFALCTMEHGGPTRRYVLSELDSLSALLTAAGEIIRAMQAGYTHHVELEFMSVEEARAHVSLILVQGARTLRDVLGTARGIGQVLSYFLALLELIRLEWCTFRVDGDEIWLTPCPAGTDGAASDRA